MQLSYITSSAFVTTEIIAKYDSYFISHSFELEKSPHFFISHTEANAKLGKPLYEYPKLCITCPKLQKDPKSRKDFSISVKLEPPQYKFLDFIVEDTPDINEFLSNSMNLLIYVNHFLKVPAYSPSFMSNWKLCAVEVAAGEILLYYVNQQHQLVIVTIRSQEKKCFEIYTTPDTNKPDAEHCIISASPNECWVGFCQGGLQRGSATIFKTNNQITIEKFCGRYEANKERLIQATHPTRRLTNGLSPSLDFYAYSSCSERS